MYRQRGGAVALVMGLSWVGHVGFVVSFWCCARALWDASLGPIPSLSEHFLLVPIGLVMQAVVPTPGGAGAGEWGFAALYLLFRAAEANGVLASLVQRIMSWVLGLVGLRRLRLAGPGGGEGRGGTARIGACRGSYLDLDDRPGGLIRADAATRLWPGG